MTERQHRRARAAVDAASATAQRSGERMLDAERAWFANLTDHVAHQHYLALESEHQRDRRRVEYTARQCYRSHDQVIHRLIAAAWLRARCRRPVTRAARPIGCRRRASRPTATSTGDPESSEPPRPRAPRSSAGGASC